MFKWAGCATAAFSILCSSASAGFSTGNQLLADLQGGNKSWAYGYIAGVADAENDRDPEGLCFRLPAGATTRQLSDIVEAYLVKHSKVRHNDSSLVVRVALADAFPCPPPPPRKP